MSDQDFQSGRRGEGYQPGMDRASWEAGKKKGDVERTILDDGPKTEVDGAGCTVLLLLPLIPLIYPLAGISVLAIVSGVDWCLRAIHFNELLRVITVLGLLVVVFFTALPIEKLVSRFLVYRLLRYVFRFAFITVFVAMVVGGGLTKHARDPKPGEIATGMVIAGLISLGLRGMDKKYGFSPPPKAKSASKNSTGTPSRTPA